MPKRRLSVVITEKVVERAKPRSTDYVIYDAELLGFGLRVYPTGRKAYVMRLRFVDHAGAEKQRMHTVGDVSDFQTVKDARTKATEIRAKYKQGRDLHAEQRKKIRKAMKLSELRDAWLEDRMTRGKHRELTQRDIKTAFKNGFGDWLDKPLGSITGDMLSTRHKERSQRSPSRANLEARYLRALWRWSAASYPELELPAPPTTHLGVKGEWNKIQRKKRRLDATSAQAWFKALDALSARDRALCLLVTYSGMRVGEAMQLRWEDVDLKAGTLVLHQTKTDPVSLPLARQAKSAIKDLPKEADWIFPAVRRNGEIGPITQVATAIANLKTVSGVQWSPHDARRGFISMSYKLGMPESISRRLTNHAMRTDDAHDGYTQMTASELAPFAQRIADHLESMLTGATVVTQLQPVERTDNTDTEVSKAVSA